MAYLSYAWMSSAANENTIPTETNIQREQDRRHGRPVHAVPIVLVAAAVQEVS